jgi:hypothetical protein
MHGIKNLLSLKEEKAAALDDNKKTHAICTCIYAYNLKSSSHTYQYRSYCVNTCYPHSLGLPPSTVASSTVAPIHIFSSTVAPTITKASTSTVASPSTVAPTNIIISSTVALISTVASPSTEAPHDSTRNTEWPLALNYNIPDAPMLSHRPHIRI